MAEQKTSVTELYARLDELKRLLNLGLNPAPLTVYKPNQSGQGVALKVELRLEPTYHEKGYITDVAGGLFFQLVAQTGKNEKGYAQFGWEDEDRLVAKCGVPDITALLVGMRFVRLLGKPVPESLRSKSDDKGVTVSLFHKFGDDNTVIELQFTGSGSFLRISKSKTWNRSIKLTLQEELALEHYLQNALTAFQQVGK